LSFNGSLSDYPSITPRLDGFAALAMTEARFIQVGQCSRSTGVEAKGLMAFYIIVVATSWSVGTVLALFISTMQSTRPSNNASPRKVKFVRKSR
jgi:hypothetical protein